jgi:hypothetical protein
MDMRTLIEIQLIEVISEGLLKSELSQCAGLKILLAYITLIAEEVKESKFMPVLSSTISFIFVIFTRKSSLFLISGFISFATLHFF